MIVTERFVFLHLHKSGGTFVNRLLAGFFPDARQIGYHLPRAYLPSSFHDRPVLGTVRNPWEYYVSWHAFQTGMSRQNALYDITSNGGRLDFDGTIRNLVTLPDQPKLLEALRQRLPDQFPGRGINLTRHCLAPLGSYGAGFYSFMYERMYGRDLNLTTLLDTRSLRGGLIEFLTNIGTNVTPAMRDWIIGSAPLNRSEHGHYSSYYDESLRKLVAERDATLISRHDYRFEQPPEH